MGDLRRFAEQGATDATKTNKDGRTFYVFDEQFSVSSSNGLPAAYLSVQKDSNTLVRRTLEIRTFNRTGTPSSPDDLDEQRQELEPLQLGTDSSERPTVSLAGVFLDEPEIIMALVRPVIDATTGIVAPDSDRLDP